MKFCKPINSYVRNSQNYKPKYSTWIRKKKIIIFWSISFLILFISLLLGLYNWHFLFTSILALPFIYISTIISLTAYYFSEGGKKYQNIIHDIMINSTVRKNGVLDIGCGNGSLIIKIAKTNQNMNHGIDYWDKDWEYSQKQCELNASYENVKNVIFTKASASNLPFDSSTMDNIVSCLTFHEVKGISNKCEILKESIRVLKSGGTFTFLDLFNDTSFFPNKAEIRQTIIDSGCIIEQDEALSNVLSLPFPLNNKRVLKYAVIIAGRKA